MEHTAPPLAPPIQPGIYTPGPSQPVWPTVIGVIAIAAGAIGILGGLGGLLSPLFMGFAGTAHPEAPPGIAGMREWFPWMIASALLNAAIAAVLLAGGIGLVTRRPWSARVLLAWAMVRIPVVILASILGYFVQEASFRSMQQQPARAGGAMPAVVMHGMLAGGVIFALLWGWALPGFMLVWFSRSRIRQQGAAWRAPPPP